MTTTTSNATIAALAAEVAGPDPAELDARIGHLPVSLALSAGIALARSQDAAARDAAARIYERLRPMAANELRLDDSLARLAQALGRADDAVALIKDRLARRDSLPAWQSLVRVYLDAARYDEAEEIARSLTRERGGQLMPWLIRGDVALARGDAHEAEAAYQQAQELTATSVRALLGLAKCRAAAGDAREARALAERALAGYEAPTAGVLNQVAEIARALGEAEWAAEVERQRAELEAREVESLRSMVAGALGGPEGDEDDAEEGARTGRWRFGAQRVEVARAGGGERSTLSTARDLPEVDEDVPAPEPSAAPEEEASPELLAALRATFGHAGFLPGQATVVSAVMRGEDVLALMPTGAGKSLCYQLPALLLPGTTVLISPLIALMKDQLDGLPIGARSQATVLNSQLERDELDRRLAGVAAGRYKLVYVAPERLRQQSLLHALRRAGVARFVVDEAHCVSLWGHDFRPDYLFIAEALRALGEGGPPIPVLALTATAAPEVRESIADALGRELLVVNRGVFRPNLRYEVRQVANNDDRLRALAALVREEAGAGIVYVRSRDGCEEVAEFLRRRCNVRALHYHAGMERGEREAAQTAFIEGRARVVVATVAFGMGIDKRDVRFIVHYQLPGSLEAYVQESGRAGRDGAPSRCVLFVTSADAGQVRRHIRQDELSVETLRTVYAKSRELVRASAPPGAPFGRVASADLEREVSAAIEAGAAQGQRIDETAARVALSLLERAELVRRRADVPRAPNVRLAGTEPDDSGDAAAFRAFVAAARLRPQQFATLDLVALAHQMGTLPAALEERLLAWRDAGVLEYRDGARDLLLEIPPPPADAKTRLPNLLGELAERHERQIDELVAYTKSARCRQKVITRHFGERLPVAQCGVCDVCTGESGRGRSRRAAAPQASVAQSESVRETVLACLRDLPYAVGVTGLVRLLRGSPDVSPSGQRSPQYGALAGMPAKRLQGEILVLVEEGVLIRDDAAEYPTLRLREGL